ncbi:GPI-anchored protein LORELEI [Linum grandiflorum]
MGDNKCYYGVYVICFILFNGLFANAHTIPYELLTNGSSSQSPSQSPSSGLAPSSQDPKDVGLAPSSHGLDRKLIEKKKQKPLTPCNVSFDDMDYSVFERSCQGDHHTSRKQCCAAWKLFVCPIRQYISERTDCVDYVFYNIYMHHPTMENDYFANYCKEPKKKELDCLPIDQFLIHHGKNPVQVASPIPNDPRYRR